MAVKGLEKFKEYFSDFKENYVIIGGTACSIILRDAPMKPRATKDICYYNTVIQLGDTDLIATTLWSKIRLEDAFQTEAAITDFKRIRNGDETLDWVRFNEEHSRCFQFLNESVKNSKAKHIIVISHHVPSFELNAREFKGSNLNGAFTVELGGYIAESPINYWIYGHSHRNINKTIGRTQCVTNQLGYVFANEHLSFNPKAYIELE